MSRASRSETSGVEPVWVGVGSSLGDRRAHVGWAAEALRALPGVRAVRGSPLYETAPVGGVAARRFWNGVLELAVESAVAPETLLDRLLAIEAQAGRRRTHRWEDRTLDLDILLWQDRCLNTGRLVVPHPELHRRRFVLVPLVDLAPERVHPVLGRTLRELLAALPAAPGDVTPLPPDARPPAWPAAVPSR